MNTDKVVARILVVALTVLAAIGLIGTLYLLGNNKDGNSVAVFVGLAGVPMGAVAALATTKTGMPVVQPEVVEGPQGPPGPPGPSGSPYIWTSSNEVATTNSADPLLDELSSDVAILPGG